MICVNHDMTYVVWFTRSTTIQGSFQLSFHCCKFSGNILESSFRLSHCKFIILQLRFEFIPLLLVCTVKWWILIIWIDTFFSIRIVFYLYGFYRGNGILYLFKFSSCCRFLIAASALWDCPASSVIAFASLSSDLSTSSSINNARLERPPTSPSALLYAFQNQNNVFMLLILITKCNQQSTSPKVKIEKIIEKYLFLLF